MNGPQNTNFWSTAQTQPTPPISNILNCQIKYPTFHPYLVPLHINMPHLKAHYFLLSVSPMLSCSQMFAHFISSLPSHLRRSTFPTQPGQHSAPTADAGPRTQPSRPISNSITPTKFSLSDCVWKHLLHLQNSQSSLYPFHRIHDFLHSIIIFYMISPSSDW